MDHGTPPVAKKTFWYGPAFVAIALIVTAGIGILTKRSQQEAESPGKDWRGSAGLGVTSAELVATGLEVPRGAFGDPVIGLGTAMWAEIKVSNRDAARLRVEVIDSNGNTIPSATRWRDNDAHVLIHRGYLASQTKASVVVSSAISKMTFPLPKLPDPTPIERPPIGPIWPGLSVERCNLPIAPAGGADPYSVRLMCRSSKSNGNPIISQLIGTSANSFDPSYDTAQLVSGGPLDRNKPTLFNLDLFYPRTTKEAYLRVTELTPTIKHVHLTFPTKYPFLADSNDPKISFSLYENDLDGWKGKKPVRPYQINLDLKPPTSLFAPTPKLDLEHDVLLGPIVVRSFQPDWIDGTAVSLSDSLRALDGNSAELDPASWNIGLRPASSGIAAPHAVGKRGDPFQIDMDMVTYHILRSTTVAVDLTSPMPVPPKRFNVARSITSISTRPS